MAHLERRKFPKETWKLSVLQRLSKKTTQSAMRFGNKDAAGKLSEGPSVGQTECTRSEQEAKTWDSEPRND